MGMLHTQSIIESVRESPQHGGLASFPGYLRLDWWSGLVLRELFSWYVGGHIEDARCPAPLKCRRCALLASVKGCRMGCLLDASS